MKDAAGKTTKGQDQLAHTPGPWHVDRHGLHVMAGDKLVAGCGGHQDNFTPDLPLINKANARLIAATPTLLAAIEILLLDFEDIAGGNGYASDWIDARCQDARAAIKKARGQQ